MCNQGFEKKPMSLFNMSANLISKAIPVLIYRKTSLIHHESKCNTDLFVDVSINLGMQLVLRKPNLSS